MGQDREVYIWDNRDSKTPSSKYSQVHTDDINCCAWNATKEYFILTGGSDGKICLLDTRTPGKVVEEFINPAGMHEVVNLQWNPHDANLFASSDTHEHMVIWSLKESIYHYKEGEKKFKYQPTPGPVFFRHCGHRSAIADFRWNPRIPWTFFSSSDEGAGGIIQCYRLNTLLTDEEHYTNT